MPFKSEKQRRYLWKNHPVLAQRWADKYGSKPLHQAAYKKLKEKGYVGRSKQNRLSGG